MSKLTKEQQEKLSEFFQTEIDSKDFVKQMRKLMYITINYNLQDSDCSYNKDVANSYFWLTSFTEILDPTGILE